MPEGLYDKYTVTKKRGETDPEAIYFVLRIDKDPKARIAAAVYAVLCEGYDNHLASDLHDLVQDRMTPLELALYRSITHRL